MNVHPDEWSSLVAKFVVYHSKSTDLLTWSNFSASHNSKGKNVRPKSFALSSESSLTRLRSFDCFQEDETYIESWSSWHLKRYLLESNIVLKSGWLCLPVCLSVTIKPACQSYHAFERAVAIEYSEAHAHFKRVVVWRNARQFARTKHSQVNEHFNQTSIFSHCFLLSSSLLSLTHLLSSA